ncbi:hypothetical protein B0H13DRAFT_1914463 [Mycena leptocephala]|nr:hypothetical protein B0H13DRAFT_1914463 [Mycena leptocephala]
MEVLNDIKRSFQEETLTREQWKGNNEGGPQSGETALHAMGPALHALQSHVAVLQHCAEPLGRGIDVVEVDTRHQEGEGFEGGGGGLERNAWDVGMDANSHARPRVPRHPCSTMIEKATRVKNTIKLRQLILIVVGSVGCLCAVPQSCPLGDVPNADPGVNCFIHTGDFYVVRSDKVEAIFTSQKEARDTIARQALGPRLLIYTEDSQLLSDFIQDAG